VTTNMMGDIVTDLAAVLQGGMGMAASGNVGDRHGMFEGIHGSAPKMAGQNSVNPVATISAAQMMLSWLGETRQDPRLEQAGVAVEAAVMRVLAEGGNLTFDLGGTARTSDVGTRIATAVAQVAGKGTDGGKATSCSA
jgi:isocitrate/isopropylmalate dehydrogenase